MVNALSKSFFLLFLLVFVVCGIYPFILWCIGQSLFPFQANGSILRGPDNKIIGSKLIAQPFTKDEYFQPRPSAASYDATASSSSALAASNYALRSRVANSLGTIVKYTENNELVGPDIEKWFQNNTFQGKNNIVEQWATLYPSQAKDWVNKDPSHLSYVEEWSKKHGDVIQQFILDNPTIPNPKPSDLAVVFFHSISKEFPGKFPVKGTPVKGGNVELAASGVEIQSTFFELWRQDNPEVSLQEIPGDFVTTSASGLDPHITLQNAQFQLERVAAALASRLNRDEGSLKTEIMQILDANTEAPFAGLFGEPYINVLEVNLELNKRYGL